MRRDLAYLLDKFGPRALGVVIVAAAVIGAVVGGLAEAVRSYTRPNAPKGTPPS
jgi:uncharacterized integral membrane protein